MAIEFIKNPEGRNDPPRPLMEHLLALRDMLKFMALAWAIGVTVVGIFAPEVLEWLKAPANQYEGMLQSMELTAPFRIWFSIAAWGGTALSFPLLVFAVLRFVFPALTNREKAVILSILCTGTALFVFGVYLAYTRTLPLVIDCFREIGGWMGIQQNMITLESYIPVILKLILAFGLVFQLPLVIFILGWFGLVSSRGLREKRRVVIVLAFVVGMILTPPDPMSQCLMAVPLVLLYELSIWAVWLKERAS